MQARGPLMIEHRLIERMLEIIKRVLTKIEAQNQIDPLFVDTAVDFIKVYADRTHHGKEEDILFRELDNKPMNEKKPANYECAHRGTRIRSPDNQSPCRSKHPLPQWG